ncbi:transcription elongation factor GreA [soil metagenome]
MTETSEKTTWLTQEAYDRLTAELDRLAGPGRADIAKKIEAAREEGDLKENGGYHAAKEEQGKQEARIRQLQALLPDATVGEAPPADGVAEPGMVVTVRGADDKETMRFLLGSREDSGVHDLEVYSPQSPLGGAVIGKRVGERASYDLPNGRAVKVEIVEAVPYSA